jgi:hypothetical protein
MLLPLPAGVSTVIITAITSVSKAIITAITGVGVTITAIAGWHAARRRGPAAHAARQAQPPRPA